MQTYLRIHWFHITIYLLLCGLLVGCTFTIQPPEETRPQGTIPPVENPAVLNVRQILTQQLQADLADVEIVSVEEAVWPDACLGAAAADELCAQVQTPGYRITLAVNGAEYVFHTD